MHSREIQRASVNLFEKQTCWSICVGSDCGTDGIWCLCVLFISSRASHDEGPAGVHGQISHVGVCSLHGPEILPLFNSTEWHQDENASHIYFFDWYAWLNMLIYCSNDPFIQNLTVCFMCHRLFHENGGQYGDTQMNDRVFPIILCWDAPLSSVSTCAGELMCSHLFLSAKTQKQAAFSINRKADAKILLVMRTSEIHHHCSALLQ